MELPGRRGSECADRLGELKSRPPGRRTGGSGGGARHGVAYRNWGKYVKSPDFKGTRFIDPYDFLANNSFPLDREGHGTFVTGEIAEATNNHFGLTGLAYGATIMPLRVLTANGIGDAATIARGIRYAAAHHAQVINLSIEFQPASAERTSPSS